jgi:hypothetical protein
MKPSSGNPEARTRVGAALLLFLVIACKSGHQDEPEPGNSAVKGKLRWLQAEASGEVAPLVRTEAARATSKGRQLLVYVGAVWCEPCQRFHQAAEHGDLDGSLPDLTILEFDLDRDRERLAAAGYTSRYIPLFARPKPDGTASGKQVEGGIKGDGAAAYVTAKVQALLANSR